MKAMKLPKQLFVRVATPPNGSPWFQANATLDAVMDEGDGPETIGVYQLVETTRVEKILQVVGTPKRTRR
jgi:hypothetical protein